MGRDALIIGVAAATLIGAAVVYSRRNPGSPFAMTAGGGGPWVPSEFEQPPAPTQGNGRAQMAMAGVGAVLPFFADLIGSRGDDEGKTSSKGK